jgi:hypothetical protein
MFRRFLSNAYPSDPCGQWFVAQLSLMGISLYPAPLLLSCFPLTRDAVRLIVRSRLHACAVCCKAGCTHAQSAVKPVVRMRSLL